MPEGYAPREIKVPGLATTPRGFIPSQDMGYLIVVIQLPDAASFERTDATVRHVDEIARKIPGVAHTFAISGYSSVLQANQPNVGAAFLVLDKFENRKDPNLRGDKLLARIRKELSVVQEGRVRARYNSCYLRSEVLSRDTPDVIFAEDIFRKRHFTSLSMQRLPRLHARQEPRSCSSASTSQRSSAIRRARESVLRRRR